MNTLTQLNIPDGNASIDTYKKDLDDIIDVKLKYDWDSPCNSLENTVYGTAHCPTDAPRAVPCGPTQQTESNPWILVPIKKSQKGIPAQIVPSIQTLKNHYTLLWDMSRNEGYINIVAVMQKFSNQQLAEIGSIIPTHYENNEVPMSVMLQDLLNTYKYGWKIPTIRTLMIIRQIPVRL